MFTTTVSVSSVICDGCGELISEGAACAACGAPRPRQPFFYPLPISKLAFFGATGFGLFMFGWFYSQWRADAPNEGRFSSAFKALFSPYFFYTMAREVKEEAGRHGVPCRYSPAVVTAGLCAFVVAVRVFGRADFGPLLLLLTPVPLVPVQAAINRINAVTSGDAPRPWRRWQIGVAVVLGMFWALLLLSLALPDPPEAVG